jgi:hypothetical protein
LYLQTSPGFTSFKIAVLHGDYIHNVFKKHFGIHPFQKDSPGAGISSIAVQYAEAASQDFTPFRKEALGLGLHVLPTGVPIQDTCVYRGRTHRPT